MAQRTALLNGNNINRDTDFSKYIESVSAPGVIEGLEVSASSVAVGKARVPCERTNGDIIYALFYNTSAVSISGNGDVYIEVSQTYIDDGELANEDGTGIAEIKVGTMPAKNALKLATKSGSTITDERVFIKKISELDAEIQSLFSSVDDLDERVEALEEADAIDHLEESGLVGELYTLNDKLFKQYTPTLADSTLDCNVGDVAGNTQIHIQRQGSGVASNQLKLKVKKIGSPTQNLIVEVRRGVQVTVTENVEAYWYGNEVIASGSIDYSSITTSYAEYTVTLNNSFGENKGELLDIVLYQNNSTVNASHYFSVACDSTQYSEGFSYVSVNGSTRTRSKLMPYCLGDGFAQSLLVKAVDDTISISDSISFAPTDAIGVYSSTTDTYVWQKNNASTYDYSESMKATLFTADIPGNYSFKLKLSQNNSSCKVGVGTSANNIIKSNTPQSGNALMYEFNNIPLKAGETLYAYVYLAGNAYSNITLYKTANPPYSASMTVELTKKNIPGIPLQIKSLGDLGVITILGIINKDFFLGQETTEHTTGNITPGNCVGFLQLGKYKIPYYL